MTEVVKDAGLATKIYCVDKYAPEEQKRCLRKMSVDFHESDIEMFDSSVILELKENDIFFIDSSHVLKNFGDVEYIYVHLFPIIPRGVIVHIHDIFLPFNYPANWLIEWKSVLTEQHILGTWLDNRKDIQIIAANNWNISQRLVPNSTEHNVGGSFWFKML